MKKIKFSLNFFLIGAFFAMFLFSCQQDEKFFEKELNAESGEEILVLKSVGTSDYISGLYAIIDQMVTSGYLNKGNSTALAIKIELALKSLGKGDEEGAVSHLKTFVKQVNAFVHSGRLPVSEAEKLLKIATNGQILIKGSFLDVRDGYEYKVILMGDQLWMAENLKYLPEITLIPGSPGSEAVDYYSENFEGYWVLNYWGLDIQEAKSTYEYQTAGVLYTHPAALKVAPAGWHLTRDEEWEQLAQFVSDTKGPYDVFRNDLLHSVTWEQVGLHLKSTTGWGLRNGLDDFGFTAYPTGQINPDYNIPLTWGFASWWTSSIFSSRGYPTFWLVADHFLVSSDAPSNLGFAVRCVKD